MAIPMFRPGPGEYRRFSDLVELDGPAQGLLRAPSNTGSCSVPSIS